MFFVYVIGDISTKSRQHACQHFSEIPLSVFENQIPGQIWNETTKMWFPLKFKGFNKNIASTI